MADFQSSTHRAKWIFAPRELAERHQTANQRAIKTLEQYGTTRMEVDIDGSFSYPEPQFSTKDNAVERQHSLPKPLKTDEEQLMRVFYEFKIQEVCKAFGFPHKIQATAIIYFKRFYLHWSVMEHHPKHIMLTCIYASCKVEENHVSAEELGKGIQQDHQIILNNEMIVLQSLEFDLIIYAPYRSIEGFVDDMENFCQANNHVSDKLQILREVAKVEVDKIMLTDAPLLFPPGQLSLAALRRAMEEHKVLSFERYMESIFSRQRSSHTIQELNESLSVIDSLVRKLKIPTNEDMKPIDRKLQKCQENKKREKKSKHKSKRASSEMQGRPAASVIAQSEMEEQTQAQGRCQRGHWVLRG